MLHVTGQAILYHLFQCLGCDGPSRYAIHTMWIGWIGSALDHFDGYKFTLFIEDGFSDKWFLEPPCIDLCTQSGSLALVVKYSPEDGIQILI